MSAEWVCPTTCQYAEDVGMPGAASPPCPGGYCKHYAPTTPPAERDPQPLADAERIERVLAEHGLREDRAAFVCDCGYSCLVPDMHRAHVAAALADRLSARPAATPGERRAEVDRVARLLMAEWERVEEKPVGISFVATFADMARAVIADRPAATTDAAAQALRDAADEIDGPCGEGGAALVHPWMAVARSWLRDRADRLDPGTRTAHHDTGHHGEGA